MRSGPDYGYNPNAEKTILIVKRTEDLLRAKTVFSNTGVNITCEGERHLGAVIGSDDFRTKYIQRKVEGWVSDVVELSKIAKEEPQNAYTAFTKGLCHRWTFLQRTIDNVSKFFEPLEEAIRNKLIPALVGLNVSDLDSRILALPLLYGGIGI